MKNISFDENLGRFEEMSLASSSYSSTLYTIHLILKRVCQNRHILRQNLNQKPNTVY